MDRVPAGPWHAVPKGKRKPICRNEDEPDVPQVQSADWAPSISTPYRRCTKEAFADG